MTPTRREYVTRAIGNVDATLKKVTRTGAHDEDAVWLDELLDERLKHMGDRDRGFRVVDRRRVLTDSEKNREVS